MDTWKKFAIIFAALIPIIIALTLLAINFNGWGTQASKIGGPFFTGAFKAGAIIPTFALLDGYRMLIVYLLAGLAWPLLVAFIVWHWDVPYKFTGATATSPATNYDNTMKREPEEPERAK